MAQELGEISFTFFQLSGVGDRRTEWPWTMTVMSLRRSFLPAEVKASYLAWTLMTTMITCLLGPDNGRLTSNSALATRKGRDLELLQLGRRWSQDHQDPTLWKNHTPGVQIESRPDFALGYGASISQLQRKILSLIADESTPSTTLYWNVRTDQGARQNVQIRTAYNDIFLYIMQVFPTSGRFMR